MPSSLPKGTQFNDQGQVAMRYMQQRPAVVSCNGNEYAFVVRAQVISFAWIEPEDVDCMLAVRRGCGGCGGKKKNVIFLADETHTRRWVNGGGR